MKQLQIVTLRVMVVADTAEDAINKVDAALSFGSNIYHPQFLACVPLSPKSDSVADLEKVMETTSIAIPFGNDFLLVDGNNGGLESLTGSENSAYFGIIDPETGVEISTYLNRCDEGVSVELYGPLAEDSLAATYLTFSEAAPEKDEDGLSTFEVFVTRDITETATVKLKASTKEEAKAKALEQSLTLNYSTDDGIKETYVADCQEVA